MHYTFLFKLYILDKYKYLGVILDGHLDFDTIAFIMADSGGKLYDVCIRLFLN